MGRWKHRLTKINAENKTALCAECGEVDIVLKCKRWACRIARRKTRGTSISKYKELNLSHNKKRKEKRAKRLGPHCEVCGATNSLRWDHDHKTGKHRGTLCNTCNLALGLLKDE